MTAWSIPTHCSHSLPCASNMWNKELQEQLAVYQVAIVNSIVLPVDRH